ncbi:hypothetical protein Ancab_030379 [Ancistrocladus abbreviatus]
MILSPKYQKIPLDSRMANLRCLQLPVNPLNQKPELPYPIVSSSSTSYLQINKSKRISLSTEPTLNLKLTTIRTRRGIIGPRLAGRSTSSSRDNPETQNNSTKIETTTVDGASSNQPSPDGTSASGGEEVELSELGKEIKKMMKDREEKEKEKEGINQFLNGVSEEIREIEWPAFGKVVRTTGVVLGVIAGSSIVLLTVNAILAELSDRLFAGKGVQDFFG